MKGKISSMWRVVIALALVLGLSLVAAVPAVADSPADTDVGFELVEVAGVAEWSTDAANTGSYSVKLTASASADYAKVKLPISGAFSDFVAPSFYYKISDDAVATMEDIGGTWPIYVRSGETVTRGFFSPFPVINISDGTTDVSIIGQQWAESTKVDWTEWDNAQASTVYSEALWHDGFNTDPGIGGGVPAFWGPLSYWTEMAYSDFDVVDVGIALGFFAVTGQQSAYVDDITIDGTTYELEPIFLDKDYYSVGDTVVVTVPNFNANTDPIRVNPATADEEEEYYPERWQVTVTSDSDSLGITVDLEETGANTGVFTGSFTTVGTKPAGEDELYVQDGDDIIVTYNADWGTGTPQGTPLTVLVDDTAPTIAIVSPEDGEKTAETTPEISAEYSDDPNVSGIDEDSVEILLDGVDVTEDATVTGSAVTYTPTEELSDGSYDVTVNVSDNAGNAATKSWSFRVVSWLVGPETGTGSLDALDTVGVAVSGATGGAITVGRYASNPEPEAALTFSTIENGFFDVKVTGATTSQIVIKFADDSITAESTAYVWDDIEGEWLECSDQGYNSVDEYLWVKVRTNTTPSIAELEGTPFAISGVPEVDILAYYRGADGVISTSELLTAITDWAAGTIPSGFTESLTTTQLLSLITEWAS